MAKREVYVDTLCILAQPKEGQQQIKNKNNQNCQKVQQYGSPSTKNLKKKHSFRLVEGEEMGNWDREDVRQGSGRVSWWVRRQLADQEVTHSRVDKLGGTTGKQDRPCNPGLEHREIKPQSLGL